MIQVSLPLLLHNHEVINKISQKKKKKSLLDWLTKNGKKGVQINSSREADNGGGKSNTNSFFMDKSKYNFGHMLNLRWKRNVFSTFFEFRTIRRKQHKQKETHS